MPTGGVILKRLAAKRQGEREMDGITYKVHIDKLHDGTLQMTILSDFDDRAFNIKNVEDVSGMVEMSGGVIRQHFDKHVKAKMQS